MDAPQYIMKAEVQGISGSARGDGTWCWNEDAQKQRGRYGREGERGGLRRRLVRGEVALNEVPRLGRWSVRGTGAHSS